MSDNRRNQWAMLRYPSKIKEVFLKAVKSNDVATVKELILGPVSHELDVDEYLPETTQTPLVFSINNGRAEMAIILMRAGANINGDGSDGVTPLIASVQQYNNDIFNELLARRHEREFPKESERPLLTINEIHPRFGNVLTVAASMSPSTTIQRLIAEGADVNEPDYEGKTPLWFAVDRGILPIAEKLLERGASLVDLIKERAAGLAKDDPMLKLLSTHGLKANLVGGRRKRQVRKARKTRGTRKTTRRKYGTRRN
jgi:ankyrin repeat protein